MGFSDKGKILIKNLHDSKWYGAKSSQSQSQKHDIAVYLALWHFCSSVTITHLCLISSNFIAMQYRLESNITIDQITTKSCVN